MKKIYLALTLLILSFAVKAQEAKVYIGEINKGVQARSSFFVDSAMYMGILDTNFTPRRKGAIVFKNTNNNFYGWDGLSWKKLGGSITISNTTTGLDSVVFTINTQCFWTMNIQKCYDLSSYFNGMRLNYDSTKWILSNNGIDKDSVDRGLTPLVARDGLIIKDTPIVYKGVLRAGKVLFPDQSFFGSTIVFDGPITWTIVDSLNTPAVSPLMGEFYLVGDNPTGGGNPFITHAKQIAEWNGTTYDFHIPTTGNTVYKQNGDIKSEYTGVTWRWVGSIPAIVGGNRYPNTATKLGQINNQAVSLITNNTARITISASGAVTFNATTGTGTRVATLSAAGTISTIANSTNGFVLTLVGGTPTWAAVTAANLQAVTTVGNWTTNNFGISTDLSGDGFGIHELVAYLSTETVDVLPYLNLVRDLGAGLAVTKVGWDRIVSGASNAGSQLFYPVTTGDHYFAVSVNGNYADFAGNITISTSGVTASNGVTLTSGDVKLGGTLLAGTSIATAGNTLTISTSTAGVNPFRVTAGTGAAITTATSGGNGITTIVTGGGFGGAFFSSTGIGVQAWTQGTGAALQAVAQPASTNTVVGVIRINRQTSGTPANGIGASVDFEVSPNGGSSSSNQLISIWDDATFATRTSRFRLTGYNSATLETWLDIKPGGIFIVNNGADSLSSKAYARSVGSGTGTSSAIGEEFTGSTSTTLTTAHTYIAGSVGATKNGVRLPAAKFTATSTTTVVLTDARLIGDIIQLDYKY